MAIEIANLVQAMLSFTSADPPVLIDSEGFIAASLARAAVGRFTITPEQLLEFDTSATLSPGVQVQCQMGTGGFVFGEIQADGTLDIITGNVAGAAADTLARVDVVILKYPTKV